MGKRMITYLLVLWRSGISVFDVYLSGTERAVDFCASVSGGRNRLSYFCGERLSARVSGSRITEKKNSK